MHVLPANRPSLPWRWALAVCLAAAGVLAMSWPAAPRTTLAAPPIFRADELAPGRQTTWQLPDSPQIEAMTSTIITVLNGCQIDFTGAYGDPVQGFVPGKDYPMIFVRDTSTLMSMAAYFYPAARLASPIEEFLRRQYDADTVSTEDGWAAGSGAISAVIAPDGHIDKATAVSDEETHLIHAAYVYFKVAGGEAWLQTALRDRRVIDRLNAALDWLYAHRLDAGTGLIERAHTTDWGDVKLEPAPNPTDIDPERDVWTASIYDQALTYRAARELVEMNHAVGDDARAVAWQTQAETLRQRTERLLWEPEEGMYATHLHLTPLRHPFAEGAMVSIANAVAVRCGLTDNPQARLIFDQLEQARQAAGASKPGVVLYPPYPAGTFAEPRMGPGQYQNGALWDWWAGWQVLGEFESGLSTAARIHLAQIAADWATHPGRVYEWQSIGDNSGHGPADYAGAAATVGESVVAGLFGVTLDLDGVTLQPRLGEQPGFIRVYQPAADRYAAYRYTPQPGALYVDYGSNASSVLLSILLPAAQDAGDVRLDEQPVIHTVQSLGPERYVQVAVPSGIHRLTVVLRP